MVIPRKEGSKKSRELDQKDIFPAKRKAGIEPGSRRVDEVEKMSDNLYGNLRGRSLPE